MILEVLANIEDLERIAMLELEGRLWKGAWAYSLQHALAYMVRLVELQLRERPSNV